MTVLDLTSRLPHVARPAYRGQMNPEQRTVRVPDHISSQLAADVLALPIELLRWLSLVGPHVAGMEEEDRARVLGQMGNIAGGGGTPTEVNVAVGENVVQVTTIDGDVNQGRSPT